MNKLIKLAVIVGALGFGSQSIAGETFSERIGDVLVTVTIEPMTRELEKREFLDWAEKRDIAITKKKAEVIERLSQEDQKELVDKKARYQQESDAILKAYYAEQG